MSALILSALGLLSAVESGSNPNAVGPRGEVGDLQITEAYVADVNRILGREEYTNEDRKNKQRSWDMARVYLEHYCTEERIGREVTLQDCVLIHHRGPNGWKLRNAPECRRYWRKVRAAMVAQGGHAP